MYQIQYISSMYKCISNQICAYIFINVFEYHIGLENLPVIPTYLLGLVTRDDRTLFLRPLS